MIFPSVYYVLWLYFHCGVIYHWINLTRDAKRKPRRLEMRIKQIKNFLGCRWSHQFSEMHRMFLVLKSPSECTHTSVYIFWKSQGRIHNHLNLISAEMRKFATCLDMMFTACCSRAELVLQVQLAKIGKISIVQK